MWPDGSPARAADQPASFLRPHWAARIGRGAQPRTQDYKHLHVLRKRGRTCARRNEAKVSLMEGKRVIGPTVLMPFRTASIYELQFSFALSKGRNGLALS